MKTVLCVPGHDERKIKRCREYGADLILFDLEDSVPDDKKDLARELVAAHVTERDAVRVCGPQDFIWADDLAIGQVWVPKRTRWMWEWWVKHPVVYIVETPELLLRLHELTDRSDRDSLAPRYLAGLAFGAADFAAYMNVSPNSPQVAYARQQVALAAATICVPAYDSPCTNIYYEQVIEEETRVAAKLGYGWKGAIHPRQVPIIQKVNGFDPRLDRQLVDQYDAQDEAVVAMQNGRVVAPPMVRAARRRLEQKEDK